MSNLKYKPLANKYKKYGAYHWSWLRNKESYKNYVDFVKKWIKEKNVLDIGAGDGVIVDALKIRGIDSDPEAIRAARSKNVYIDLGDAHALPYADEEFESAFMGHTMEHLKNPRKAIQEAGRVIKSYLYIIVPEREGHYRTNQEKLIEMLVKEDFILEGIFTDEHKVIHAKFKK
jgi:ubiquinone/menaquinone biosynthesis C-methylase UbiE